MSNDRSNPAPRAARPLLPAAITTAFGAAALLAVLPSSAVAQTVIRACYVPNSGTVYRVGALNTAPNCLQPSHVAFQWTDGADAFTALEQAVKKTDAAAGDVTGVFSNLTVARLLGRALATTPPTEGQVLAWNATNNQWEPRAVAAGGGATAHSQLTGLDADDHLQYLRLGNRVEAGTARGFAVSASSGTQGTIPTSGSGIRFMWHAGKRAIRAGFVNGTQWDEENVGQYSAAFGTNVRASGVAAFAVGRAAAATGEVAIAMGDGATSSGAGAVALGTGASATAIRGYAIGNGAIAAQPRSVAIGQDAETLNGNGEGSFAIGRGAVSGGGQDAFAIGAGAVASGPGAQAYGFNAKAQEQIAIAVGWNSTSTANGSMALGPRTMASGNSAVAIGDQADAGGFESFAIGARSKATASAAFAIGTGATAGHTGAMVLSDANSGTPAASLAANQLVARFAGGFRFRTSVNSSTGCNLPAGGGQWDCQSDRHVKTAFSPVDGESLLGTLRALPISTWEYQTERGARHLGPMAQDFRAAFGLGSDEKSIGVLDASGVALAATQALEARTRALQAENTTLRGQNDALTERLTRLEAAIAALEAQLHRQR